MVDITHIREADDQADGALDDWRDNPVYRSDHQQKLDIDPLHRKPFPWFSLAFLAVALTMGAIFLLHPGAHNG
jgi:hypothetical protein